MTMRKLIPILLAGACTEPTVSTEAIPITGPIDCSTVSCTSADEPTQFGYRMFDQNNFTAIVDGWGRTRQFFVHIPDTYDTIDGVTQKVPVIFAFHGGGQTREAMIDGKWGDKFDQDYAFVIPLGEADPCDNPSGNGELQWMHPSLGPSTSPGNPHCDAASQVVDHLGNPVTYWNASLPGAFTDVLFVEELRQMVLDRFPKLNPDKVYATGFSSGGGMTLALACYRGQLFRGFSAVAKTFDTDNTRGDYDGDGIDETDVNSLQATCGMTGRALGSTIYATGITDPQLWGRDSGYELVGGVPVPFDTMANKPVALFVGSNDPHYTLDQINATGLFVRDKNNLNSTAEQVDPFQNTRPGPIAMGGDAATTQRRTYRTTANTAFVSSTFRRFYVTATSPQSGQHAIPDADECPPGYPSMTCDYNYTDQTIVFWQDEADLSLAP
jgi:poly(3-hydroxybutyrate) depolymerase